MSNLLLNFGYFVLLEIVFFTTARSLSGHSVFGWIGCGLLMMQQTVFLGAGGLFDCRIDFIAYCLYGVFVCLMLRSKGLREKRWLLSAAGCALLMMSFRFITFSYMLGFCTTLFTALLGVRVLWRRGRRREKAILAQAMWRAGALGLGFLIIGGTLIALNWRFIHDYYVVGHLTGNEKHIRAAEVGVTNLTGHLTYYGQSLWHDHLGTPFLLAWLVLAAVGLAGWMISRRRAATASPRPARLKSVWLVQLLIIFASLFAPWFILTLDESKSGLVANVLVTPATLLVISLVAGLNRPHWTRGKPVPIASLVPSIRWWYAAAAIVLVLGAFNWLDHLTRQGRFSERRSSVEQIGALYDFLGSESAHRGFDAPRIAADVIYDWIIPSTINVTLYERSGQWLKARPSLGTGIFSVTRAETIADLENSDIALVTTFPKIGPYPFYDSMRSLAGEIGAWCDAHLMRTRVFQIDEGQVTVYMRPNVILEGLSGEWITPDGIRLRIPGEVVAWMRANGKKSIILEGAENPAWLPKAPVASAQQLSPDGLPGKVTCPAEFTLPGPGTYRIRVDLGTLLPVVSDSADVVVAVGFAGAYFVPNEVGINEDSRHLIVSGPRAILFE